MKTTIFWLHLAFIVAAWLSPLLVDWKIILLGIGLLSLQYVLIGGCYLTFLETGKGQYDTFYYHHLSRYFPRLNKRQVWLFARFYLPLALVLIGYILQKWFGVSPILPLW